MQSAALVGCGKTGVKVAVGNTADVSARAVFVRRGVGAGVSVTAGASVAVAARVVSLEVGGVVCVKPCPAQAESIIAIREAATNSLLIIIKSPYQNIIIWDLDFSSGSLAICSSNVSRVNTGSSSSVR